MMDDVDVIEACHPGGKVKTLAEIERAHIEYALGRYKGRISEMARRLKIGRTTLYRKLAAYGLHPVARSGEGWHSRRAG